MGVARDDASTPAGAFAARRRGAALGALAVWGPGLVVMLADTDAGSLVTAAQSGWQFGYGLVLAQLALVPALFVVQEIVVRLGLFTGLGQGALIRRHLGRSWGVIAGLALFASSLGALLSEFVGVAGAGEAFGVSKWLSIPVATAFLVTLAFTRSYRRVERVALGLGLAELAFIPAMLAARPRWADVAHGLTRVPLADRSYLILLAANVGAVIMPWMIFYQQGAIVDKGLGPSSLRSERRDTLVGALSTQAIMIAVIVAFAASSHGREHAYALRTVSQMVSALGATIGAGLARVLVGAAVLGASLLAALVVSLAASWGLSEVFGWSHSLNDAPSRSSAGFYATYILSHVLGAALVLARVNIVSLAVDVEVLNALLLPLVLVTLLVLERRALSPTEQLRGLSRRVVTLIVGALALYGLLSGVGVLHAAL